MVKNLYITLGTKCNANCSYCFIQEHNEIIDQKLDSRIIEKILESSITNIVFFGGEPLLYWDDIVTIVEGLSSKEYRFGIISNGILLTEDKIEFINKYKINFALSHDGPKNLEIRKYNSILDTNPQLFSRLNKFTISCVINSKNYDFYCINDYFENIGKKINKKINIRFELIKSSTFNEFLIFDDKDFENTIEKLFLNMDFSDFESKEFNFIKQDLLGMLKRKLFNKQTSKCGADYGVCHIDLAGNTYICHDSTVKNGNILVDGFKPGALNHYTNTEECKSCEAYSYCAGGCPISAKETKQYECYVMKTIYKHLKAKLKKSMKNGDLEKIILYYKNSGMLK